MPQRNRIRTINGGPQGDDAKLIIIMPTVGEMREQAKAAKLLDKSSDEMETLARQYISSHIQTWNWVDDNGEPMPSPNKNPDALGDLTNEELAFVGECLAGHAPAVVAEEKK